MAYSESAIQESVNTVYLNSKRQAKRALVTNYANGDINFIGDCCFAYSGDVSVANTNTTMLLFTTGPSFLKVKFEYHGTIAQIANNQLRIGVNMNDVSIIDTYYDTTLDHTLWDSPPTLIIPPFTKFEMFLAQASGVNRTMQATLTGQVYAGAEIIQGAI